MSDKVKLPKEVAEAIESLIESRIGGKEEVLEEHVKYCVDNNPFYWEGRNEPFNKFTTDEMVRVLYIGYEVEQTPEDVVRDLYDECGKRFDELGDHQESKWWSGRRTGILDTLNVLNIKISGVNAE